MIPDWWEALLLSLAAWRMWHLLTKDDILDRPRRYVTRVPKTWKEGDPPPRNSRYVLIEWLECPFCSGWWVALGWWGAWLIWPHGTLVASVPFVMGAGVVAAQQYLTSAD